MKTKHISPQRKAYIEEAMTLNYGPAAAEAALNDGERLLPSSVLYFRAARLGKEWGKRTYYATIGANSFFK